MFSMTSMMQWLLYFYIYCFLGWVFESCYVSARKRRWVNRGFLRGPLLPIYGCGAVMMLAVSEPFKDSLLLTYFAGVIGATLLEYVTGAALEAIFKVRYWDYSDQRFQIRGYICLSSSIAWGFFTIGMNEFLHPWILTLLALIPMLVQEIFICLITIYFLVDTMISVRDALDLRDVIIRIEEAKKEMERLQRRMDVVIAVADAEMQEFKEEHPTFLRLEEHREELKEHGRELKERLDEFREKSEKKLLEVSEKQWKEVEEIQTAWERLEEKRKRIQTMRAPKHRRKLRGNPSMRAPKHPEALEILKEILSRK